MQCHVTQPANTTWVTVMCCCHDNQLSIKTTLVWVSVKNAKTRLAPCCEFKGYQ